MTLEQFYEISKRIRNNGELVSACSVGRLWEDLSGNWYAACEAGYNEYLFYAGDLWTVKTRYVGNEIVTSEPEKD